jgi:hypothetical protein
MSGIQVQLLIPNAKYGISLDSGYFNDYIKIPE